MMNSLVASLPCAEFEGFEDLAKRQNSLPFVKLGTGLLRFLEEEDRFV